MNHHTQKPKINLVRLVLSFILLIHGSIVLGHHPHDIIDALAVSPSYTENKTLYMASTGHLFKSTNGGYSWNELVNGLDNLHPISSIQISLSQDNSSAIFISTLGDGIYRSTDDGKSWATANANISDLAVQTLSARPGGTILAISASGQLNISTDNGMSWHLAALPGNAQVTAVSPATLLSNSILAGDASGVIYQSDDNGSSWNTLGKVPGDSEITIITLDPSDATGNSIFVGTGKSGLYRSNNKGSAFDPLGSGLPDGHITSLAFSPSYAKDHTLFATTWHDAIFISTDRGNTWTQYKQGLTTSEQADTAKYHSPHFSRIRIAGDSGQELFLAGFDGLFQSTDQGHSWEEIETLPVRLVKSLDVSTSSKNGEYSIAIGTYGGGAYISHDKGKSWTIGNKGLNTTRIGDIKFSPAYPKDSTLFSGSIGFLLQSEDRGSSWEKTHLEYNNLRKRIVGKLMKLGLPRDVGKQLLEKRDMQVVYPDSIAISPDYASDHTIFIGTRYHGLYMLNTDSMELDHAWEDARAAIHTIALSPYFSSDHTAFLFVRGDGLYKSTDHGRSWRRISTGLPFKNSRDSLAEIFTHKNMDVAFSPSFDKDHTLFAAGPMGIYKSTDRGDTWNSLKDDTLGTEPNVQALGISPNFADDRLLLVSVKGRGLFRSMDGGSSFSSIGSDLLENNQSIELVGFSSNFQQDSTIYAASDQELFISLDKGNNWAQLNRPVRYEDRRDAIKYTGNWTSTTSSEFSASTAHHSDTPGDNAKLKFAGCGIRWLATKSSQGGIVDVFIDGTLIDSVDLHSASLEAMSEVFIKRDLDCGPHTIKIELTKSGNGNAVNGRVTLDAFDVLPPG